MLNEDLIKQIQDIASYYDIKRDKFRSKTYHQALMVLENYDQEILNGKQVSGLKGIGKSLAADIDQYLTTGHIDRLDVLKAQFKDRSEVIDKFLKIYGVGPVKANQLFDRGYRTVEQLAQNIQEFTSAQQWGISYYYHFIQKIPRAEIDNIVQIVDSVLKNRWPNIVWTVTGSYRRGETESGDIDLFIRRDPSITMDAVLDQLARTKMMIGQLAKGDNKFLGVFRLSENHVARRMDILLADPSEWAYAILYFTGSRQFNILLRFRAEKFKMTLNEKRMLSLENGETYPAQREEDIFNYLGVKYLTPEQRVRNMTSLELV